MKGSKRSAPKPPDTSLRESEKRPGHWRFLMLVEVGRGRFTVCFLYTRNLIDRMLRDLIHLTDEDKTESVPLAEAVRVGDRIEKWLDCRPEEKGKATAVKQTEKMEAGLF